MKIARAWATVLSICAIVMLWPMAALAHKKNSPENPSIILGMIGGAGLAWKYVRTRYGK